MGIWNVKKPKTINKGKMFEEKKEDITESHESKVDAEIAKFEKKQHKL